MKNVNLHSCSNKFGKLCRMVAALSVSTNRRSDSATFKNRHMQMQSEVLIALIAKFEELLRLRKALFDFLINQYDVKSSISL